MNRLAPSVKTLWGISTFIIVLFLTAVGLVVEFSFLDWSFWFFINIPILSLTLFSLGIIATFLFPALRYKYWGFEIREKEIYIEHGVITRTRTVAPIRRIQHIDVTQSLFQRFADLGQLIIYTAGTRGSDLVIPGLPYEYAEELRDYLKNLVQEDEL